MGNQGIGGSKQDQVVAVDHFVGAGFGEDLIGAPAGEAAGELVSVGAGDGHDGAGGEASLDVPDAGSEEAATGAGEGEMGAGIDGEGTGGAVEEGDPAFPAGEAAGAGDEEGAFVLVVEDAAEDIELAAGGDDHGDAGAGGDAGGLEFGDHATDGGGAAGTGGEGFDGGIKGIDHGDAVAVGSVEMAEEAVGGGEDDEEIGGEEGGDEGGEAVVVAELEFGDGDGVVFVDDGDEAAAEEGEEGVAGVEVAGVVGEVLVGEEDLGDAEVVVAEEGLVHGHEAALSDGRTGLELGEIAGAGIEAEGAHAGADGAGGDEDGFEAGGAEGGELGDELGELDLVGAFAGVGEDAGPEFDDDASGLAEERGAHGGCASRGVEGVASSISPFSIGASPG